MIKHTVRLVNEKDPESNEKIFYSSNLISEVEIGIVKS